MSEPKERPILFSGPMVRAILAGRKTQTRRVVKPQPDYGIVDADSPAYQDGPPLPVYGPIHPKTGEEMTWRDAPWKIGDRLWVRESFMPVPLETPQSNSPSKWDIVYAADGETKESIAPTGYNPMLYNYERWSPSIHMARWASRITLKITDLQVERVQDIGIDDAIAEAILEDYHGFRSEAVNAFHDYWDSLNTKRGYGWDANPWVWVIEFRRTKP